MATNTAYAPSDIQQHFENLENRFDLSTGSAWCYMRPVGRACFTVELLRDMHSLQRDLFEQLGSPGNSEQGTSLRYQVLASKVPGIFNLGGDLRFFHTLVEKSDKALLFKYMKKCIEVLYNTATGYAAQVTTISLIQGDALGGGFEAALSANTIIAERSAKMGFPERLFNLFPGMGAYSFLSRRVEPIKADRIIRSAKIYNAQELYDMGVIDILVDDGEGEQAVYDYIGRFERYRNGYLGMMGARNAIYGLSYQELIEVGTIWVEAALKLTPRDLRLMKRLAMSQEIRSRQNKEVLQ